MCDIADKISQTITAVANKLNEVSVRRYLSALDLKKSNEYRFVAWLMALDILPKRRTGQAAADSYKSYMDIWHSRFDAHDGDPVLLLPPDEGKVVRADIDRSINWFMEMASCVGLSGSELSDAEQRVSELLTIISLEDGELTYTQGFDRFAFMAYLISLNFAVANGLPSMVAEAFGCYLASALIKLSDFPCILADGRQNVNQIRDLDLLIEQYFPEVMESLRAAGNSSIHFALRWEILMFADEHFLDGLFLIWDQLILHRKKDEYRKYMTCLCLAHVSQVQVVPNMLMVGVFQTYKTWDVPAVIDMANKLFYEPRVTRDLMFSGLMVAGVALAWGMYAYMWSRK